MTSAFVLAVLGNLTGEYATIASVCVGAYNFANSFSSNKEQ